MVVFEWRRRVESPTVGPSRSAGDTTKTEDRGNCRPDLTERFVPSPLTPHERRHAYASLMIGAGVNAKTLSTYMGHANISITLDRTDTYSQEPSTKPPRCSTLTWPEL